MCRHIFLVLLLLLLPSSLFAQDEAATHSAIRKSLAYVEVSGQRPNGVPLQSSGTGVLMDEIGHVLTVLHLITKVEANALDNQFEITVRIGDRNGTPRPATVIRRDNDRDVLVLRIQTAAEPYPAACFGDQQPPLPRIGDFFLTSGFPLSLGYFTGSGKVTTTDGPRGLFGVDIPISDGQSGSPVYDDVGRVLGLLVGSLEGEGIAGQHYFRPLKHIWDVASSFAARRCEVIEHSDFYHNYSQEMPIETVSSYLGAPVAVARIAPPEIDGLKLYNVADETQFFVSDGGKFVDGQEWRLQGFLGKTTGHFLDQALNESEPTLADLAAQTYGGDCEEMRVVSYRVTFVVFKGCWYGRPGFFLQYDYGFLLGGVLGRCEYLIDKYSGSNFNEIIENMLSDVRYEAQPDCLIGEVPIFMLSRNFDDSDLEPDSLGFRLLDHVYDYLLNKSYRVCPTCSGL